MPYDMAVTSLLGSMMFEKTIKAVATNIVDMDEAVGGWDFTSCPLFHSIHNECHGDARELIQSCRRTTLCTRNGVAEPEERLQGDLEAIYQSVQHRPLRIVAHGEFSKGNIGEVVTSPGH